MLWEHRFNITRSEDIGQIAVLAKKHNFFANMIVPNFQKNHVKNTLFKLIIVRVLDIEPISLVRIA